MRLHYEPSLVVLGGAMTASKDCELVHVDTDPDLSIEITECHEHQ